MRNLLIVLLVGIALCFSSCRKDFAFEQSSGGLEFSKDTVYLDTVFTNIGSSTYRLKVFNRSDKDISIPQIRLGKGTASKYRLMVDGMTGEDADHSGVGDGKIFDNVELLAKDSLFIFIEVTSDVASANPTDFLYTDQIQFTNTAGAAQTVELVTLIQDAVFIYPQRDINNNYEQLPINFGTTANPEYITGSNLNANDPVNGDELNWTSQKPYVIYGYALVPDGSKLTINAGARVHFHANSGLIIARNGQIEVKGEDPNNNDPTNLSKEVIFQGDRLEPDFADIPGQWGAIINYSTRTDNSITHLTIKNAVVGMIMQPLNDGDIVRIDNYKSSQIYNCSNIGILSQGGLINGENLMVNNCGQFCLAAIFGGTYNFTHCTFNNNWSSSKQFAVLLRDFIETDTAYIVNSSTNSYNFSNCIIYGSNQMEYYVENKGSEVNNYNFNNCLIKFNNSQLNETGLFNFNSPTGPYHNNCYISKNNANFVPRFKDISKNKLWPTEDLTLAPYLMTAATTSSPTDMLGKSRTAPVTIGAYQFIAN
ncbi:hypothetical protein OX284_014350 [Flavobacterium sp. SUN046]|uniref:hypothetical protein n=1 Tax=Flavobacterium sp. SUN046 TaxID=3002440 RepID=UPI002DB86C67|nr:hypothetical protein [Flavobacterium sp. SUN046]MEC4050616.1 hypothetical protein [Flavobacterium sp. SUN046]